MVQKMARCQTSASDVVGANGLDTGLCTRCHLGCDGFARMLEAVGRVPPQLRRGSDVSNAACGMEVIQLRTAEKPVAMAKRAWDFGPGDVMMG